MRICTNCNKQANNDASFCQYCGTGLDLQPDNTINNDTNTTDIIYVEPINIEETVPLEQIDTPQTHYSFTNEEPIIIDSETISSTIETNNKKLILIQIGIITIVAIIVGVIVSHVLNFNDDFL